MNTESERAYGNMHLATFGPGNSDREKRVKARADVLAETLRPYLGDAADERAAEMAEAEFSAYPNTFETGKR